MRGLLLSTVMPLTQMKRAVKQLSTTWASTALAMPGPVLQQCLHSRPVSEPA